MESISFSKVFLNDDEPYQEFLQVLPISFEDNSYLYGDHIILSPYSSDILFRKKVQQPMKFRMTTDKHCTYCSVAEFSCDTGLAMLPKWMMNKMELKTGDYIRLESISLPKATLVTIRLCDRQLLHVTDIKTVFEEQLQKHVVLAEGDVIPILYEGLPSYIEIVKCEPSSVVDINNANVSIDFAPMDDDSDNNDNDNKSDKLTPASSDEDTADNSYFQGVGHSLASASQDNKSDREKRLAYFQH